MPVPMADLCALHAPILDEIRQAIDGVLASQRYIMGPEVTGLEREIADYCDVKGAVGVSSGTDALVLALMAHDVGPGDEVITTPYTFFATGGAIHRLGAKPVFVDIDPDTFNMDPAAALAAVTERTRGFIPVHLFGQLAECGPLVEDGAKSGRFVLEDAAQSIGAERDGKRAGSIGGCGTLSFFPAKNLGALGDGGMIVSNDEAFLKRCAILRSHGAQRKYYHDFVGGNFRLDALQAAVLRVKLKSLEAWHDARLQVADRYDAALADLEEITTPRRLPGRHIWNQYVVRARRRDELREHLTEKGIGNAIYYPVPLHRQPCFAELGYQEGQLPVAEAASRETLALPINPVLPLTDQELIVDTIRAFYRGNP